LLPLVALRGCEEVLVPPLLGFFLRVWALPFASACVTSGKPLPSLGSLDLMLNERFISCCKVLLLDFP
jgi:hypothetical protein